MSSPLPPDPYVTLGVASTADLATIRIAHRKLVLKCHPDRIRDEADREKGKMEFQKVQQAYEILSDENRRERYDSRVKLAELQRERILRDSTRQSSYSTKSTTPAGPPPRREMRSDGRYYEERAPPEDYFDVRDRYDEPIPRAPARKQESYEKKSSSTSRPADKKERSASSKFAYPVEGISIRAAMNLKAKAQQAKERTRENEKRDREKNRDRSEKYSSRRAATVEDDHSDSDSDTVTPNYHTNPSKTSARPRADTEPELSRSRTSASRRPAYNDEDDSYDERRDRYREEEEKWERHHQASRDYITQSQKRPGLDRTGSDANHYWNSENSRGGRRSGDEDKRPSSSRRAPVDETRPRPSMPAQNSAPSKLHPYVVDREPPMKEPQRSKTSAYPSDRDRREPPPMLSRSQTMPVQRGSKRDSNIPAKGSNLKHGETHDSGYSSNSNPHSPDMQQGSPPRETSRRHVSTKYAIVEPDEEEDSSRRHRLSRMVDSESDERPRRYRSPEQADRRDRDERRPERPRLARLDTDTRSRSARGPEVRPSMPRADFARYESPSPRASPTSHRKGLFGEIPDDRESSYSYRPEGHVRTASYRSANYAPHRTPRENDDYPTSPFRPNMHGSSRRSSVNVF